jgi:hypothetical protein
MDARAQQAAATLADILDQLLADGIEPATLALTTIGLGADLLAKATGTHNASDALHRLAEHVLEEPEPSRWGLQ